MRTSSEGAPEQTMEIALRTQKDLQLLRTGSNYSLVPGLRCAPAQAVLVRTFGAGCCVHADTPIRRHCADRGCGSAALWNLWLVPISEFRFNLGPNRKVKWSGKGIRRPLVGQFQ
jgi:hypothetical protein